MNNLKILLFLFIIPFLVWSQSLKENVEKYSSQFKDWKVRKLMININLIFVKSFNLMLKQKENNKTYQNSTEQKKAESNFIKNFKNIQAHNARKNETYKRGVSSHSDLSYEQKVKQRMGVRVERRLIDRDPRTKTMLPQQIIKNVSVPDAGKFIPGVCIH